MRKRSRYDVDGDDENAVSEDVEDDYVDNKPNMHNDDLLMKKKRGRKPKVQSNDYIEYDLFDIDAAIAEIQATDGLTASSNDINEESESNMKSLNPTTALDATGNVNNKQEEVIAENMDMEDINVPIESVCQSSPMSRSIDCEVTDISIRMLSIMRRLQQDETSGPFWFPVPDSIYPDYRCFI